MGRATFIGFLAVVLWALLALFTDASGAVPPFQLAAMSFAIGALVGLAALFLRGKPLSALKADSRAWAVGVIGLFGYHFFYFTALRNAPAVDASLIAYLWPLFIVAGSALMPGERLRIHHVAGTLMGLAGTALIVTKGKGLSFDPAYGFGYAMAFVCAFLWSGYSLLSRRLADVPSDAVTGFCAATAVLALGCHLALEETVWPATTLQWLAVLSLGLGPVGAAFYFWDHGVKQGNIQVLGASSYGAPLFSTLVLIAAGFAEATLAVMAACLLITGGAILAAWPMLTARGKVAGEASP